MDCQTNNIQCRGCREASPLTVFFSREVAEVILDYVPGKEAFEHLEDNTSYYQCIKRYRLHNPI